jgi:hypothetical protein
VRWCSHCLSRLQHFSLNPTIHIRCFIFSNHQRLTLSYGGRRLVHTVRPTVVLLFHRIISFRSSKHHPKKNCVKLILQKACISCDTLEARRSMHCSVWSALELVSKHVLKWFRLLWIYAFLYQSGITILHLQIHLLLDKNSEE